MGAIRRFTGTHITGIKYYEVNTAASAIPPSLCLDGGYSQLRGELLHRSTSLMMKPEVLAVMSDDSDASESRSTWTLLIKTTELDELSSRMAEY